MVEIDEVRFVYPRRQEEHMRMRMCLNTGDEGESRKKDKIGNFD